MPDYLGRRQLGDRPIGDVPGAYGPPDPPDDDCPSCGHSTANLYPGRAECDKPQLHRRPRRRPLEDRG